MIQTNVFIVVLKPFLFEGCPIHRYTHVECRVFPDIEIWSKFISIYVLRKDGVMMKYIREFPSISNWIPTPFVHCHHFPLK